MKSAPRLHPKIYFLLASTVVFVGCETLPHNQDIYSSSVKETHSGMFNIEIEARLEQKALNKTLSEAKKTCHSKNKKRVIIVDQKTEYTHGNKSKHATGYHTAKTYIKCK